MGIVTETRTSTELTVEVRGRDRDCGRDIRVGGWVLLRFPSPSLLFGEVPLV